MATKLETTTYTQDGKESGKLSLPEAVFGAKWNADLVHSVVISMQANARAGTAHTKDRSEVRGGGKKPWRQKGTGRARHGSRRSPIWTGGGITFGPRNEKDYTKKINSTMRARALASVLSKKFEDGETIFVDSFSFAEPKTKEAKAFIEGVGGTKGYESLLTKENNAALVILSSRDENTEKSFRNLPHIDLVQAKDVSPVALLTYKYVIIADPKVALKTFENRVRAKAVRRTKENKSKEVNVAVAK